MHWLHSKSTYFEVHKMRFPLPAPAFSFAGFTFPKFAFTLPRGTVPERIERMRRPRSGPYYHAPKPENAGIGSFYLESDFAPKLRWQWCDEVDGVRIDHEGWFCDREGEGAKLRGVVYRLPRGRGFIAGWSMGEKWSSTSEPHIYKCEREAAYAANRLAENAADRSLSRAEQEEESEE
jgi:hypothetical protein